MPISNAKVSVKASSNTQKHKSRSERCTVLEVGTANAGTGQLAFYQKCGFEIDGIDRDFFRRNYPDPIFENGIECRHMVRLRIEL